MIQTAAKCPNCGAAHNPLLHPSFRDEAEGLLADQLPTADSTTYTWLCEACGETYQLDVAEGP